jgi:hypothetical protein
MVFLCVSIPARACIAFRRKKYFFWEDDFDETNTLHDIRESYSGHHVRDLFIRHEVPP